jgi:hypothetical protein
MKKLAARLKAFSDGLDKKPGHPAKIWPTRWFFDDRSDEEPLMQIIDILTDLRNIALLVLVIWVFS